VVGRGVKPRQVWLPNLVWEEERRGDGNGAGVRVTKRRRAGANRVRRWYV